MTTPPQAPEGPRATEEIEPAELAEITPAQFAEHLVFFGYDPAAPEEETREWPGLVAVEWKEGGFAGAGWYMWCSDYPDEGAAFVSPAREPYAPLAAFLALGEPQP